MSRILVVEDETNLRALLSRLVQESGHEARAVATGTDGLAAALTSDFDLILLELALPDVAGEHVVSALMAVKPGSRIMVVSSVTDVHRRVGVLDAGAVDFVAKPFANEELLARIRARMRGESGSRVWLAPDPRAEYSVVPTADSVGVLSSEPAAPSGQTQVLTRAPEAAADVLVGVSTLHEHDREPDHREPPPPGEDGYRWPSNNIHLDSHRRALVVRGRVIDLSQREFVLMSHLLQRRGQICTRQELLADVWGVDFDPGTNVVDVYVRRLRSKLSDNSIETVRNYGYRLIAS